MHKTRMQIDGGFRWVGERRLCQIRIGINLAVLIGAGNAQNRLRSLRIWRHQCTQVLEKRWVTRSGEAARGEAAQRRSRFGRAVYPVPCVGDGGGTSSTVAAVKLGRAGPAARPDKPDKLN